MRCTFSLILYRKMILGIDNNSLLVVSCRKGRGGALGRGWERRFDAAVEDFVRTPFLLTYLGRSSHDSFLDQQKDHPTRQSDAAFNRRMARN